MKEKKKRNLNTLGKIQENIIKDTPILETSKIFNNEIKKLLQNLKQYIVKIPLKTND